MIVHREVGCVHDLILNKNTGYVIESWDELELRMNELYNNSELCDEFSKNAVRLMEKEWNYKLYKDNLASFNKKSKSMSLKSIIKNTLIKISVFFLNSRKSRCIFYHDIHSEVRFTDMSSFYRII